MGAANSNRRASILRIEGRDEPIVRSATEAAEPTWYGHIDDACRRALGLATPPPETSTLELWARIWLHRIVSACADPSPGGPPHTWAALARLHPVFTVFPEGTDRLAGDARFDIGELVKYGRALDRILPWYELRAGCADDNLQDRELLWVSPDLARWMDVGMFSRWVVSLYPDLDDLGATVNDLLAPALSALVQETVERWGLLGSA